MATSRSRQPFADRVPRPAKRAASRATPRPIPANIRVAGLRIDDEDRARIRERLGRKLGKFAGAIERVSVRLEDVNGPRGGVDTRCRIKVVLRRLPSVVFESQAASYFDALTGALAGAEKAVRRAVRRKRANPVRSRRRQPAAR